ncbi:glutamate synthase-related protein [Winogradskyella maritima]|nr:glutamate synthase-related protein [Winogradskyella maritima]
MIEIKLSQGAKPGHGGILPAVKNTPEIAKIPTYTTGYCRTFPTITFRIFQPYRVHVLYQKTA